MSGAIELTLVAPELRKEDTHRVDRDDHGDVGQGAAAPGGRGLSGGLRAGEIKKMRPSGLIFPTPELYTVH